MDPQVVTVPVLAKWCLKWGILRSQLPSNRNFAKWLGEMGFSWGPIKRKQSNAGFLLRGEAAAERVRFAKMRKDAKARAKAEGRPVQECYLDETFIYRNELATHSWSHEKFAPKKEKGRRLNFSGAITRNLESWTRRRRRPTAAPTSARTRRGSSASTRRTSSSTARCGR